MKLGRIWFWMFLSALLLQAQAVYSAPSADYSQAVSLFQANNFRAALPLFQQIIQDDPGNAMAYYYLGSCQETVGYLRGEVLNYYISNKLSPDPGMTAYADKLMDKLSPEDQDWVEKHLDAFSNPASPTPAASPAPASTAASAASTGHLSQGITFFEAGDYSTALSLLQKAIQEDPSSAKAYYYLGRCEKAMGDTRDTVLHFYISDRLASYPELKAYADKKMEDLSREDRKWVNDQLAAWKIQEAYTLASIPAASAPESRSRFGFRLSAGLAFFNLADFQQDLSFHQYLVSGLQAAYPNDGINLQTALPSVNPTLELNPYLKIDPNIELGLAFVYWPTATVEYDVTAGAIPQYHIHTEWDINTLELLLKGRFYLPSSSPKDVRLYVEPFAGLQPIYLHFAYNYAGVGATPSSDQTSADYSDMALEGGLKLGLSFYTGPNSFFSLSGSYQWASASNFQGNLNDAYFSNADGHGSLHMYKYPTAGQNYIIYIPDNQNQLSAFNETPTTINNSMPFTIDLSGFRFNADFSYTF